jgi:hypothetical protein
MRASTHRSPPLTARPQVVVDFSVDDGLLFVSLRNAGGESAYKVAVRFDRAFHGLGGRKEVSALRLFRRLDFLPPGKSYTQLVDPLAHYAARREPLRIAASATYVDRDGNRYADVMRHDLRVYLELGEIVKPRMP